MGRPAFQSLCSSPGMVARRAHHDRVGPGRALHRADDLHVGGQRVAVLRRRGQRIDPGEPVGLQRRVGRREDLPLQRAGQRVEPVAGVRAQRLGPVLHRVVGIDVEADEPAPRVSEQRPRPGGEVLKARADADHDIGPCADLVRRRAAGHADGAEVQRMVPGQRRLAGLRLDHRDAGAPRRRPSALRSRGNSGRRRRRRSPALSPPR